jgi:5-aminopentanamidase
VLKVNGENLMQIGYLQFEPEFGNIKGNVDKVREMLQGISADLLVLPELFNTGYYLTDSKELDELGESIPDGYTTRQLESIAAEMKSYIVAGVLEKDGGNYYNSAVLVGERGYIDHYRKIHLFNEEKIYFSPGDKPFRVYDIGKARIGIMICYDWIYPESMRVMALLGADIICHSANLVMPFCPGVMPSRCFDNKVFAITANRCGMDVKGEKSLAFIGQSSVIGPDGKVIRRSSSDDRVVELVSINPAEAGNKRMNRYNDLFIDRRPEMYEPLLFSPEQLSAITPFDAVTSGRNPV